jgi:DNA-binding Xre family transcriptional regulator
MGTVIDKQTRTDLAVNVAQLSMRGEQLALDRQPVARKPAKSWAHPEQRVNTGLLTAKVDELRIRQAFSLQRLAAAAGLPTCTLHKLRGELSDPRLSTVLRLRHGLGVTAGEFLNYLPLPLEPRPPSSNRKSTK